MVKPIKETNKTNGIKVPLFVSAKSLCHGQRIFISKVVVYSKEKRDVTKELEQMNHGTQNAQGFFSRKTLEKPGEVLLSTKR